MGNSGAEMKEPEHADNGRGKARQTTGMKEATVISQFHRVPSIPSAYSIFFLFSPFHFSAFCFQPFLSSERLVF